MTQVRLATSDDAPAIVAMGERFHAFSGDAISYCKESAFATVTGLLSCGFVLIAEQDVAPVGMIGVIVAPMFFNAACHMAQEAMWWVDDDARKGGAAIALIRAAEREAAARGAMRLQMVRLAKSPAHLADLYARLGYVQGEVTHTKDIK